MTKEELLARKNAILAAINAIENGAQEYELGDIRVKKANLKDLYAELFEIDRRLESLTYNTRVYIRFT